MNRTVTAAAVQAVPEPSVLQAVSEPSLDQVTPEPSAIQAPSEALANQVVPEPSAVVPAAGTAANKSMTAYTPPGQGWMKLVPEPEDEQSQLTSLLAEYAAFAMDLPARAAIAERLSDTVEQLHDNLTAPKDLMDLLATDEASYNAVEQLDDELAAPEDLIDLLAGGRSVRRNTTRRNNTGSPQQGTLHPGACKSYVLWFEHDYHPGRSSFVVASPEVRYMHVDASVGEI